MTTRTASRRLGLRPGLRHTYLFICRYKAEHDGNSPSLREIAEGIGSNSTSVVRDIVRALASFGYLHLPDGPKLVRKIEVVGARWTPPTEDGDDGHA